MSKMPSKRLKPFILVLVFYLCFTSCQPSLQPSESPTLPPTRDVNLSPSSDTLEYELKPSINLESTEPSHSPSSDFVPVNSPSPDPEPLEVFFNDKFCEKQSHFSPKLKQPFDLAVSQDGQKIYIVNKRCDTLKSSFPFYPNFSSHECGQISSSQENIRRNYVYVLENGVLRTLDQLRPLSCHLNDEIERGEEGELYFTDLIHHKVIKVDPNKNFQTTVYGPFVKRVTGPINQRNITGEIGSAILEGPTQLAIYEGQIFFSLFSPYSNKQLVEVHRVLSETTSQDVWKLTEFPFLKGLSFSRNELEEHYIFAGERGAVKYNFSSKMLEPFLAYTTNENSPTSYLEPGYLDGELKEARFKQPLGIRANKQGVLYIADVLNHAIRKVENGKVSTLAGNGQPGFKDGLGQKAQFNLPTSVDLDQDGNLYVTDSDNHAIRKITPQGEVTTIYVEK